MKTKKKGRIHSLLPPLPYMTIWRKIRQLNGVRLECFIQFKHFFLIFFFFFTFANQSAKVYDNCWYNFSFAHANLLPYVWYTFCSFMRTVRSSTPIFLLLLCVYYLSGVAIHCYMVFDGSNVETNQFKFCDVECLRLKEMCAYHTEHQLLNFQFKLWALDSLRK